MTLSKNMTGYHLKTLKQASIQYFNGYAWTSHDQANLIKALEYFNQIKDNQATMFRK